MSKTSFEWDEAKDLANQIKHGLSFSEAQFVFADPNRVIAKDLSHSNGEKRLGSATTIHRKQNKR